MSEAHPEQPRRPPPPFPLSVITGFLGAGKTTLLNKILPDPAMAETLVIINEFGEIGLDHLLIESVQSDMILLSSGCLCCTIRGDLISTLEDVLRRFDNGRIESFKRVVIETTGLADPAPILQTIMYHPYLMMRFQLQSVVTLVDGLNGNATLDAHEEAVKQAAVADRLVLTKSDLVANPADFDALRARLSALNPSAVVLDAAKGEATPQRLFGDGFYDVGAKPEAVKGWLNVEAFDDDHAHDRHGHHDHQGHEHPARGHDVNRHDERIRSFSIRQDAPVDPAGLSLFFELMRTAHGSNILRMKGIIALSDDPGHPLIVHGVQHILHAPQKLGGWPDADHTTRLVFIVKDIEPAFIEGLWKAAMGVPGIDRADRQALQDNPLVPKVGGLLG